MQFASFYRALGAGCQENGLFSLWVCYEQAVCDWKALFHARQTCKWGVVCSEERRLSRALVCSGTLVCVASSGDGISWITVCRVILYFCGILNGLLLRINTTKIRGGCVDTCVLVMLWLFDCVYITSSDPKEEATYYFSAAVNFLAATMEFFNMISRIHCCSIKTYRCVWQPHLF